MDETVTALVIVRKPGVDAAMLVDSSNVGQILPDPLEYERVRAHFIEHGFEATAGFAGTFTITASAEHFADLLPALEPAESDHAADAVSSEEMPHASAQDWLAPVAEHVAAITHSEPIDFDLADP